MVEESTLKRARNWVIERLKEEGCKVLLYEATSSNSIYIKIDNGNAGTIRISDHESRKKHLSYKWNLVLNYDGQKTRTGNSGNVMNFYKFQQIELMMQEILAYRHSKIEEFGTEKYNDYMMINYLQNKWRTKGFWASAVEV